MFWNHELIEMGWMGGMVGGGMTVRVRRESPHFADRRAAVVLPLLALEVGPWGLTLWMMFRTAREGLNFIWTTRSLLPDQQTINDDPTSGDTLVSFALFHLKDLPNAKSQRPKDQGPRTNRCLSKVSTAILADGADRI